MALFANVFKILARVLVRLALAAGMLTAAVEHLGFWWMNGRATAWGDWTDYIAYTRPFSGSIGTAGEWLVTLAELLLGLALLTGYRLRSAAYGSAVLLVILGAAMTVGAGWRMPVYYSVWTAAAAAILLGATTEPSAAKAKPTKQPPTPAKG